MKIIIAIVLIIVSHTSAALFGKYQEQQKWLEAISVGIYTENKGYSDSISGHSSSNNDNDDLLQVWPTNPNAPGQCQIGVSGASGCGLQ